MSGSAGLFNKKNTFFLPRREPKCVAEREMGNTQKNGHLYDYWSIIIWLAKHIMSKVDYKCDIWGFYI